ncbi:MAG: hypothetical protein H7Z21_07535 [Hymenobacter sp.]|nr:hypothetical protein [Hymenobacter sp.]
MGEIDNGKMEDSDEGPGCFFRLSRLTNREIKTKSEIKYFTGEMISLSYVPQAFAATLAAIIFLSTLRNCLKTLQWVPQ